MEVIGLIFLLAFIIISYAKHKLSEEHIEQICKTHITVADAIDRQTEYFKSRNS